MPDLVRSTQWVSRRIFPRGLVAGSLSLETKRTTDRGAMTGVVGDDAPGGLDVMLSLPQAELVMEEDQLL